MRLLPIFGIHLAWEGFIAVKSEKITINRPGDGRLPIGRLTVLLVKYTPI
tara:strand:+ start:2127 stop:2276 length:150 start_codon:yes stop_codon:yes gene_type:complete